MQLGLLASLSSLPEPELAIPVSNTVVSSPKTRWLVHLLSRLFELPSYVTNYGV